jgi:hypothetical protein
MLRRSARRACNDLWKRLPMDENETPETRQGKPALSRQCTARSGRSGQRCRKSAIRGGTVCATHGGSAPMVRLKARQRLDALVLPAIEALATAMRSGDLGAMLRAAQLVLDRSGFPASHKVEMSPEEVDATLAAILGIPVSQLPTIDVPDLPPVEPDL